ncbi:8491_t:CDS:2 [Scutellospora calospora]|uniref:8491_t:CDS:1 n=1 Tax=Scutellospora calospora TaxID=85575 RepID=A0ACA9L2C0_9GLOM|nr:8491_t:CDS:2 [Scutellospora calospora]
MSILHQINSDGSIGLPFGRAVENYILSLPIVKGARFKCQSQQKLNQAVQRDFVVFKCEEGAIDFKGWTTITGMTKSTNRLDDRLELTEKGQSYVNQIQQSLVPDFCVWHWVFYCAGDGNCQRVCSGFENCLPNYPNYKMKNNLKNSNDMHKCKVRIITKVMLNMVRERFPIKLYIESQHIPTNIFIQHESAVTCLNLSRTIRDQVILSRRADGHTAKEIKLKLLAPFNGASKEQLEQQEKYGTNIFKEKGFVLYYQQEDQSFPSNSPEHYYQLTISDNMWLEQARNYGSFCFGIDAKYDLNNDRAPIHSLVVEDCGNWGTPIGFALSNKENINTIRLAVEAIKANIPCKNINCEHLYEYIILPNNKGFKCIRPCAIEWKPFAMIDKHRPTKAALKPIIHGTILCWFYIMQTFRNHFRTQKIDWNLRYPIALAFKIIGRCRSITEAREMAIEYKNFINSLPISVNTKAFFINDLEDNWLSQEWILSFIDSGRLPNKEDESNVKPWTTNNFTERMNKTFEERYSGTQTVLTFIERLYGIKIARSNLTENCSQLIFNAGLVTYWNLHTIEHQNGLSRLQPDITRRINQGKLKVLQDDILEVPDNPNFLYVCMNNQKQNNFRSPYTTDKIKFGDSEAQEISKMITKLAAKHMVPMLSNYYLVNYITSECTCLDFIWHGSFRDFCKHGHAARIYVSIKRNEHSINQIKKEFQTTEKDPFRPSELPRLKHAVNLLSVEFNEANNQVAIENEHLNSALYLRNEDINSLTLNNNNINLDDSKKLSNSHTLTYNYYNQETMFVQNKDIPESQFTSFIQPKSNNPLVPIIENKNMPHSIEKRQTKRVRNNKRKIKLDSSLRDNENVPPPRRRRIEKPALEELFEE